MVSPNWPSDDDPDYTPKFGAADSGIQLNGPADHDIEELKRELETLVEDN